MPKNSNQHTDPSNNPEVFHFDLDTNFRLLMSPDFAGDLGEYLLATQPADKRILAFAHQLVNATEPSPDADDLDEAAADVGGNLRMAK